MDSLINVSPAVDPVSAVANAVSSVANAITETMKFLQTEAGQKWELQQIQIFDGFFKTASDTINHMTANLKIDVNVKA